MIYIYNAEQGRIFLQQSVFNRTGRIIFALTLCLFACSKDNSNSNALDGVYIDEYENCCLVISEYEQGKLGYYVFDISSGFDTAKATESYVIGTLSIKVNGNDSIATFTEKKNQRKESSVLPLEYGGDIKIESTPSTLCFIFPSGNLCFGKMNIKGEVKEMKDAITAMMGIMYSK